MIFMKFCVCAWALVVHGQWKSGTKAELGSGRNRVVALEMYVISHQIKKSKIFWDFPNQTWTCWFL
jgi:hypothetical protein